MARRAAARHRRPRFPPWPTGRAPAAAHVIGVDALGRLLALSPSPSQTMSARTLSMPYSSATAFVIPMTRRARRRCRRRTSALRATLVPWSGVTIASRPREPSAAVRTLSEPRLRALSRTTSSSRLCWRPSASQFAEAADAGDVETAVEAAEPPTACSMNARRRRPDVGGHGDEACRGAVEPPARAFRALRLEVDREHVLRLARRAGALWRTIPPPARANYVAPVSACGGRLNAAAWPHKLVVAVHAVASLHQELVDPLHGRRVPSLPARLTILPPTSTVSTLPELARRPSCLRCRSSVPGSTSPPSCRASASRPERQSRGALLMVPHIRGRERELV